MSQRRVLRAHRRAEHRDHERGEATLVLLLLPAVLAAVLLVFHVGLVRHGRSVVQAATADALRAAQIEGGTRHTGELAAHRTLGLAGGLSGVVVNVDRGDRLVSVEISADVSGPLPLPARVTARATGPVERWYSEGER